MLTSFNSLFIASLYISLIIGCKKSRAKNYMLLLPPRDIQERYELFAMTLIPLIGFDNL
jgi:hypothetical protein